jgi:glycosyltransferase involved in cell wall biosynthesis
MRIGIDARELCGRATGVGRYLAGLLTAWHGDASVRHHEFVLYSPEALSIPFDARRFPTRIVSGAPGTWWEQIRLPAAIAKDHLDAFFSPGYTTPLFRHIPTVVAIHDVSFAAHPEWFSIREGLRRRWLVQQAAQQARAIITISEFSRRELIERLGVAESRLSVIPPGITPPPGASQRRDSGPSVLYAGSIFNRRHVPELIRAFAPIARAHPDAALAIVGDNRSHPFQDLERTIGHEGLGGRAIWRRYVSDADLGRLYASSRAFAFLSEYEGLGLTPLEALAAGVPSLLLDTAVAREGCGDAALYIASPNPAAVSPALERLLFDIAAREALLTAAPGVLSRYDWRRAGRQTLAVIESVA